MKPMLYDNAHRLAADIRASEEWKEYHRLREEVFSDTTLAALIGEYQKLQMSLQMSAIGGQQPASEDMERFTMLSTLLFGKPEVSDYLMSEMRLRKAISDIFGIIAQAADMDLGIPVAE